MARRSNLDKQLDELAARFTPQIKSAFLTSVRDIKDTAILQGVIDAVQVGDLEAAFRATGLSPAAMRPITSMIERAFETGGVMVANSAPRGITDNLGNRAVFRFDVRNSRAERWLRDHSSNLVTRITEDTKTNIRSIVEAGVRDGRNPRNIALDIVGRVNPDTGRRSGGVVGLTRPQEQWVQNARQQLVDLDPGYFNREARDKRFDSIVRKAIKDGKPLSSEKINAITDKYSDNLLLQRGETIARTEAIQSLNKSADEAFQQAIDEGVLDRDAVTKVWDNSGDNRVRDSHVAMEGQTVKMNEPFVTPNGAMLMFPGDTSLGAPGSEVINCRCRVRHEVDWFADLENDDPPAPEPEVLPEPPPPAPVPASLNTFDEFVESYRNDDALQNWRNSWNDEEREAVRAYIDSPQINNYLRAGQMYQSFVPQMEGLDSAINRAPVFTQATTLFRTMNKGVLNVGDEYTDAAYLSVSQAEFSQGIWRRYRDADDIEKMEIIVPAGTPRALIERRPEDEDFNMTEILIARGRRFRVESQKDDGTFVVRMIG